MDIKKILFILIYLNFFIFKLFVFGAVNRITPVVLAVKKTGPAVVNISTEKIVREHPFYSFNYGIFDKFFEDFFDFYPQREYKTLGSGVIIDEDGYILTNEHIILRASKIKVTLTNKEEYSGKLIGADSNFDIAVIKIDGGKLPVAKIGKSDDLMVGETVIAIGNPFGLENTVTTGVLSAIGRTIKVGEKTYSGLLQTDASINPGNSGGPLLNLNGEVIGINTAIYEGAEGIGFAIPINKAMVILNRLIKGNKINKSYLGLRVQQLTEELSYYFEYPFDYGILVADVEEGSPADKGGIKSGDIVIALQGKKIYGIEEYYSVLSSIMPGEKVDIIFYRNGIKKSTTIKAEEISISSIEKYIKNWLGIEVENIDKKNIYKYNLYTNKGVVITSVKKRGLLAKYGLREGDVIKRFGSENIENCEDFKKSVINNYGLPSVIIYIQRGRDIYYGAIGE